MFNVLGGIVGGLVVCGIYVLVLCGDVWMQVQVVESVNLLFLVVYLNQWFLYVINELEVYEGCLNGSVEVYVIDLYDGKLMLLNCQLLLLLGMNFVYVVVLLDGKYLCVLIYSGGVYNFLLIGEDGKFGIVFGIFKDIGFGFCFEQEVLYVYMMLFDIIGGYVIGIDLGIDCINVFVIEGGKFVLCDCVQFKFGSGLCYLVLYL